MGWVETLKRATARDPGQPLTAAEREQAVLDVLQMSSLGAAAVTYTPLPLVDLVAITPIQAAMVMALGRLHGRTLTLAEGRTILVELASVCGAGLVARQLFTAASKLLLPGIGGMLGGPYAFAVTWALGRTAEGYFEDPAGTRERLKQIFQDALAEGRRLFSKEAVEEFRRKRGGEVETFAQQEARPEPPPADGKKEAPPQ